MEKMKSNGNKPVFLVKIFWSGNNNDSTMGNYSFLDEHRVAERKNGGISVSFYRSRDDAEKGYNRWIKRMKSKFDDDLRMSRAMVSAGIPKAYPSVYEEFVNCTGIYLENANDTVEFSDFVPSSHTIKESSTNAMSNIIEGFTDDMYEDGLE